MNDYAGVLILLKYFQKHKIGFYTCDNNFQDLLQLLEMNLPPKGNSSGDLLFWNNSQWNVLPAGNAGQCLSLAPGTSLPTWVDVNIGLGNISTKVASNIQPTSSVSGGTILIDGGSPITARGVVWSTSPNPTIALSTKTNDGTGIGDFISNLSGLNSATTYYVRAYATNANGTSYGNQVSFITYSNFYIGQSYGGGKIFYINSTGQHGLIVSPTDLIISINWNNTGSTTSGITTGANGFAIGTGSSNTSTIILPGNYGPNQSYAASLCRLFYNGGGYTDWSLPSLYELQELYNAKNIIGGFGNYKYWSSSEYSFNFAWIIDFSSAVVNQSSFNKGSFAAVRAVRSF